MPVAKIAPFLYFARIIVVIAVGFQLLRRWLHSRRPKAYGRLRRELHLHACEPEDSDLPELRATTQHIQGDHEGYEVRIFENVSDLVEPGYPTATQTYLMLAKPGWHLPAFTIEPRTMATNLRQHVDGNKGLFFPKDERFTVTCFVDGPDPDAIRATLAIAATKHLRDNKQIYVESRGDALLFYQSEKLLSARGARRLLQFAVAFTDGLAIG